MIRSGFYILTFVAALLFASEIALAQTLTESSGATDITPSSFEVTRGTLAFGTVADLAASDNEDVSVRRNTSDTQSIVQVVASGNSVNAFPAGIDITVESSVFARSAVIQEIHAFNFTTNSFELIDARPASRFLDRVDTVSLSGDLTRFVTPAAGNLSLMVRFVSLNNRQRFTANIDQAIWTIFE